MKRMDFKLENIAAIVAACIVLHNLCEKFGDNFHEEWVSHDPVPRSYLVGSSSSGANSARATRSGMQLKPIFPLSCCLMSTLSSELCICDLRR